MNEDELLYQLSIMLIPGVGSRNSKQLISHCGGASQVFKEKANTLAKIDGIGEIIARSIRHFSNFKEAEDEVKFIQKNNIITRFYNEDDFPFRLKHCIDGPILLFGKGNIEWNPKKALSVVGTRTASNYGRKQCESIIQELASTRLSIISGMAYGIDIHAHRAALKFNLPTVAVVAHGLDRLYPSVHKETLELMFENGGVITEFMSGSNPDRENFPKRNRIIAGFSDATLVVESGARGGSMISADIAASYNRDVFAVPGNNGSRMSEGCNYLIHTQKATLVRGGKDIKKVMNWMEKLPADPIQTTLFTDLNEDERKVLSYLHLKGACTIDTISIAIELPMSKTSVHLLNLEFKGLIQSLPGKVYKVV
jgi:DNA processing protein